ncbi:DUF3662 and FHA domain-containing protein [uncultured Olsenella sp.]|uniref:FhaA domain-containing protein n=1 Tax=uncultured Olsenella sp. TaxID=190764 RepID=UPI0026DCD981|nr:DUF3662 and FHA domain-containing protein [uncultured Olsenella sp.]
MNLLRTFESRVSDAFGAGASGKPAPFSFKKLAKRAARAMEAETFRIDGVDTAPALYTILVAPADDAVMRPLYRELTDEVCGFVEAQADAKGYAFVGRPLARFMVDPSLRAGRFAVFAENVDSHTLGRLREEEEAFVKGSSGIGGAAARPAQPAPRKARPAEPRKAAHAEPAERLEAQVPSWEEIQAPAAEEFAPLVAPLAGDASAGLNVLPTDFVDDSVQEAGVAAEDVAPASPAMDIPPTVRRSVPLVNPQRAQTSRELPEEGPSCLLIDHQSGRTYTGGSPVTIIGRERTQGGIVLRDPNVSRRHAELSYDGHDWRIADLGSTNGTRVNDIDVDSCILRDGDLITLGLMNLEFRESRA